MDSSQATLLIAAVGSVTATVGVIANMVNSYFREQRARRWAIEDKEALAAHAKALATELEEHTKKLASEVEAKAIANFDDIKANGDARLAVYIAGKNEIVAKVDENTKVSVEAFKEANGVNAKLLALGRDDGAVKKVEVVNKSPIEVHNQP